MFRYANRIVAAISLGVAVLQGAEYSGSLMTARLGVAPRREVDGVPGPVTAELSFAPHRPIQQGAKWARAREDVIAQFRAGLVPVQATTGAERASLFADALSPLGAKGLRSVSVGELVAGERIR
jgi:predicted Rossmann fold nucleotide-binding protein DprA/Smf involved in DNA uptake